MVGDRRGERFYLCRRANYAESIAQPLHDCTTDKDTTLQCISSPTGPLPRDGRQQLLMRSLRLPTGIQQHKTAGAIGIFGHPRLNTGLPEGGSLLVSCNARQWDTG